VRSREVARSREVVRALAVAVTVAGLTACGGGDDPSTDRGTGTRTTTPSSDPAAAYVGLDTVAAIAKADADHRPWRIAREDDEQFLLTQDHVPDRVTFEIDDGKVTTATLG
jgi:hypothetical protein